MADEVSHVNHGELVKLARSFETHSYDLASYLKAFTADTGEEVISDGFGVLTESEEVTSAYNDYSSDVTSAVKVIHAHLDAIGAALREVTKTTHAYDKDVEALFGHHEGGER
ncbi:hypothetical protein [Streptomyces niger]|uniref:hypothetical protein n=1 Tax=Streptomyces niger TaxID=66373 RepID=UPI00069C46F3|nr:hypothetical protein [Streptomyces niger]